MTDFERQKAEAEQRVKEMNRRYNEKASSKSAPKSQPPPAKPQKSTPFDIFKLLKLDGFRSDSDRLLLLGLFLLLNSQEADELLLYALIYIML